jgi:hypothetical protein
LKLVVASFIIALGFFAILKPIQGGDFIQFRARLSTGYGCDPRDGEHADNLCPGVRLFAARRQCRTKNQINLLHIAFENILAPVEFNHFTELVGSQQLPTPTYDWLRKIAELSPEMFDRPQGFRRQALADNVLLYGEPSLHASGKSLLIGFAGNARRLMMPIAIFLQCLDSRLWDVGLLRKGAAQESCFEGVAGVASSLSALIEYIQCMLPTKRYRRLITYGTSGGGLAAILASILMNTARGISVGGAPPKTALDASLQKRLAVRRAC